MFHVIEGWYFERSRRGGVHIVKRVNAKEDSPIIAEVYLDHDTWAIIMASVSATGETSESFKAARQFHGWKDAGNYP